MTWKPIAGALAGLAVLVASNAWALVPWPTGGAPVCTALGDQSAPLHHPGACGGAMTFAWFEPAGSADTLAVSFLYHQPPTGECMRVDAGPAPGAHDATTGLLRSGVLPGFPGCYEDPPSYAWVEGSGAAEPPSAPRRAISPGCCNSPTAAATRCRSSGCPARSGRAEHASAPRRPVGVWGGAP